MIKYLSPQHHVALFFPFIEELELGTISCIYWGMGALPQTSALARCLAF